MGKKSGKTCKNSNNVIVDLVEEIKHKTAKLDLAKTVFGLVAGILTVIGILYAASSGVAAPVAA